MTGRIKSLNAATASGVIAAEDGLDIQFLVSAVLECDVARLAVGQLVSFDVEDSHFGRAINVYLRKQHILTASPEQRHESIRLRYMGFRQAGSIRSYRFDRVSPGENTATFIVATDLALFLKHHVGIQEGPDLCLRILSAELGATGPAAWPRAQCWVTDKDMLAHLERQPTPGHRRKVRPKAPVAAAHAAHA